MLNRTIAPDIHPISSLSLTPPRLRTLTNNVPMFLFDNPQLDLIHFIIQVRAGILYETEKHTAQFSYGLLKESSSCHSSTETADLLAFYGVHLTTSVTLDKISIQLSIPKSHIADILPLIADFIIHPTFREANLDKYKNLKIKDLEYNAQKTEVQATRQMLHAMFGNEVTAGRFSTKENLQAVTLQQMYDFHHKTMCAERVNLFVTGNLDADLESFIANQFDQIPHGKAAPELPYFTLPTLPDARIQILMPNSVQTSITLCQPMFGYENSERRGFSILSTILGGYFGSRLMQSLREQHGYTYGVSSGSVYFGRQSLFIIDSNVNANDWSSALDACRTELELLQRELVPTEELENVRNYIVGDLIRDVENSVSYMKKYAFWNYYGFNEGEMQTCMDCALNISDSELLLLAKKHLNYNKFTQVIVGKI